MGKRGERGGKILIASWNNFRASDTEIILLWRRSAGSGSEEKRSRHALRALNLTGCDTDASVFLLFPPAREKPRDDVEQIS